MTGLKTDLNSAHEDRNGFIVCRLIDTELGKDLVVTNENKCPENTLSAYNVYLKRAVEYVDNTVHRMYTE